MNDLHQKLTVQRLSAALIAFFVLAGLSVLVVYFADPTVYTKVLMLESTPSDRYPLPATLFLVALLVFITVGIIGAGCSGCFLSPTVFQSSKFQQRYYSLMALSLIPTPPGTAFIAWVLLLFK
jgi:hypothetical protein